jgi:hypothetical protein
MLIDDDSFVGGRGGCCGGESHFILEARAAVMIDKLLGHWAIAPFWHPNKCF